MANAALHMGPDHGRWRRHQFGPRDDHPRRCRTAHRPAGASRRRVARSAQEDAVRLLVPVCDSTTWFGRRILHAQAFTVDATGHHDGHGDFDLLGAIHESLAAAALLALVVACGQRSAIFNVDVLSFMQPSGRDTIRYNLPPSPITLTADSFIPVQRSVSHPGWGTRASIAFRHRGCGGRYLTGTGRSRSTSSSRKTRRPWYGGTPYFTAPGPFGPQPSTVPLVAPTTVSLSDSVFTPIRWGSCARPAEPECRPGLTGKVRLDRGDDADRLQDKVF